ncbi:DNA mismatch repair protein MutS [Tepidibacter formicigenes]|jgi:DNA mismatch repair protein MutS|uniref:DNA mismatch repair protein MutS n=1 Tax=Tepidibacter formicigenes DSM 15518 TaxID=1123349 RepID=A0A1M6M5J3_9FIRM|nr:DNA mismatch repair protein MutS [Tepidibacter formicigenes]SHJ78719.1 DNA mismatch repair protein MutS [Tepidibacter formicigenes DSM 15518]
MKKLTPMMKQYFEIKKNYEDSILFFRLGDFYEMFFEDAIVASRVLEIALTGKNCGLEERAPMCGVPYHSSNSYISKLIENGYKVAICEQVEDASASKGLVKRDVVRIISPGTVMEENLLDNKKNNYLMSIYVDNNKVGISYVDITTGDFYATSIEENNLVEEIAKIQPKEIIYNDNSLSEKLEKISILNNIFLNKESNYYYSLDEDILYKYFSKEYIENLRLSDILEVKYSLIGLLNYIFNTQKQITSNLNNISMYNSKDYMSIDMFTRVNLELTETLRSKQKKGSLLYVLDKTNTAMGGRLLRKWIEQPLINKEKIEERLNLIEEIKDNFTLREDICEELKNIYDIERLCGKLAFEKINPKEMVSLKESIEKIPNIKNILLNSDTKYIKNLINGLDELKDIYLLIDNSLLEEPSITLKDGNIIKSSFDERIKTLRELSTNGTYLIKNIENREKERTGIKSLKIGFNKVFGYYIEITKANLKQFEIPNNYIRKQTLSNAERFITDELKEIEEKILNAEEKIKDLEYELFVDIRNKVYKNIDRIQKVAKTIAYIDVLTSLAKVAYENNYCKPSINTSGELNIIDGRHPVVESIIGEENFVPNDIKLNTGDFKIGIITGPNMAGKSTYMRQVSLISLLAHIGSFVPAESADIPIVDRIFTRVGASDDLSQGQSTFMVEMTEVSHILKNATKNSLVILDEIGRGTSTFDGLSLAWAIVEYINEKIGCKTLFATHYHELTELEDKFKGIKNYCVAVEERGEDIIFLRKIIRGGADQSYGIHVAKLADLPFEVIKRANEILKDLEKNDIVNKNICSEAAITYQSSSNENKELKQELVKEKNDLDEQLSFSNIEKESILKEIKLLNIINMTPIEAMNALYNIQNKVKSIGDDVL